jgi:hypothetical protein
MKNKQDITVSPQYTARFMQYSAKRSSIPEWNGI